MTENLIEEFRSHLILPLWRDRDLAVIDKYFVKNAEIRTTFLTGKGPNALKESIQETFYAFPVFDLTLEELVQQNNQITYKWSARAEHNGTILNIKPTGKEMRFHGIVYGEIKGKMITRYHSFSNIPQILYSHLDQALLNQFPQQTLLLNHENYEKELSQILFSIAKVTGACLTRREVEALNFWVRGYSIKETARQLGGLSAKTIQVFRNNIRKKFAVPSYRKLFDLLQKNGLLSLFLAV